MTPLRRCVCNAASIRETLSRPDAIHTQVGRNAHRLLLLPRALPSRWGHDRRPLRLGIVSSFVMKPIGEPGAQELGALYCLTSFVLFVGVDGHVRDYIAWISSMDFSITFGDVDAYSKVTHAGSTPLGPMAGRLPRSPIRRRPQQRRRPQPRRPHLPRAATTRGRVERQRIHLRRRL